MLLRLIGNYMMASRSIASIHCFVRCRSPQSHAFYCRFIGIQLKFIWMSTKDLAYSFTIRQLIKTFVYFRSNEDKSNSHQSFGVAFFSDFVWIITMAGSDMLITRFNTAVDKSQRKQKKTKSVAMNVCGVSTFTPYYFEIANKHPTNESLVWHSHNVEFHWLGK